MRKLERRSKAKGQKSTIAIAMLLASGFWLLTPAYATRLLTNGFEENNFTNTAWNTVSNATLQAVTVYSGTYAVECNLSASSCVALRNLPSAVTSGTYYMRGYFRWAAFPTVTQTTFSVASSTPTASCMTQQVNSTNKVRIRNNLTGTQVDSTNALSTDTWYRIEMRALLADAGGECEAKVYDTGGTLLEDISITGEDTLPTTISQFRWGAGTNNANAHIFFDDVALNDNSGSFENSWNGDGRIELLKPASDNTVTWTKTGANCSGTTNTDCVDDEPGLPDDASGYNSTSSVQTDRFNSTSLPAEVPSDAHIILADVYARLGGSSTTGNNTARVALWDETGTKTVGPTYAGCDTTTWTLMATDQHLVFDAGTRTKSNINSFDWGYEPVSLNQTCRATSVWVNVEWTPAPPAAQAMPPRRVTW